MFLSEEITISNGQSVLVEQNNLLSVAWQQWDLVVIEEKRQRKICCTIINTVTTWEISGSMNKCDRIRGSGHKAKEEVPRKSKEKTTHFESGRALQQNAQRGCGVYL